MSSLLPGRGSQVAAPLQGEARADLHTLASAGRMDNIRYGAHCAPCMSLMARKMTCQWWQHVFCAACILSAHPERTPLAGGNDTPSPCQVDLPLVPGLLLVWLVMSQRTLAGRRHQQHMLQCTVQQLHQISCLQDDPWGQHSQVPPAIPERGWAGPHRPGCHTAARRAGFQS